MTNQQTNNLFPDANFPNDLHARIMLNILTLRTRKVFLLVGTLLVVLFTATTWNLWNMVVETETADLISVILDGFELSSDYLAETVSIIINLFPLNALTIWSINMLSILGAVVMFKKFNYSITKKTLCEKQSI